MGGMDGSSEIEFDASSDVRAALDRFGRTEDVRYSPNNRRLALPSFDRNAVAVVDIEIDDERPMVTATGMAEFTAPGLDYPHGVEFLNDETIIVANRNASVTAFRLPSADSGVGRGELLPIDLPSAHGFKLLHGPSAIAVMTRSDGTADVLIGHRYADTLTRHVLATDSDGSLRVATNEVLLQRRITIVDGVAVSPDGAWIAVSNPWHQNVLVYENTASLHEHSEPDGILRGASYPHGVRFGPDGRHLFVADAGSPYVHVHARHGDSWRGVQYPAASLRAMDHDVFQRGRYNCREGGPKGVDVDRRGRVLTVTSECQPLAFFDVPALLQRDEGTEDDDDRQLSYELGVVQAAAALVEERIAVLEQELSTISRSRSYRLAQQLRRLDIRPSRWR